MTVCNPTSFQFSSLGRRQITAAFDGPQVTSDAGLPLLREADMALRLTERVNALIPDPRRPDMIVHEQLTMLRQRVYAVAAGYEDLNDHDRLREDPLMQVVSERGPDAGQPLASSPTLCRMERRIRGGTLMKVNELFVETFMARYAAPPEELVVDLDATADILHGKQEGRFFHAYHGDYCYLPLYLFCGDALLGVHLRESSRGEAFCARAAVWLIVRQLRKQWPKTRIVLRGDAGFGNARMLRFCERRGIHYIFGLARNQVLQERAAPVMQQAEALAKAGEKNTRVFNSFEHQAGTWPQARHVICKAEITQAEHREPKTNVRFIVTSLAGDERTLYEKVYCARGEMENRIKEHQGQLFADRTSSTRFSANAWRVLVSAMSYVLLEHIRRVALAGSELACAEAATIRLKLLKIGAVVRVTVRRIVLQISTAFPLRELLVLATARLRGLAT